MGHSGTSSREEWNVESIEDGKQRNCTMEEWHTCILWDSGQFKVSKQGHDIHNFKKIQTFIMRAIQSRTVTLRMTKKYRMKRIYLYTEFDEWRQRFQKGKVEFGPWVNRWSLGSKLGKQKEHQILGSEWRRTVWVSMFMITKDLRFQ